MSVCNHDYENAVRKGRARYVCPICGDDISTVVLMIEEAVCKPNASGEPEKMRKQL